MGSVDVKNIKKNNSKVRAQEGKKEAIKLTVTEAELKAKKVSEELEGLKAKPIETETPIKQYIFEKGQLSKPNHDLEG